MQYENSRQIAGYFPFLDRLRILVEYYAYVLDAAKVLNILSLLTLDLDCSTTRMKLWQPKVCYDIMSDLVNPPVVHYVW